MDEFIKLLDKDLEYKSHEIIDDTIYINVMSGRIEVQCPFCGHMSSQVHSIIEAFRIYLCRVKR